MADAIVRLVLRRIGEAQEALEQYGLGEKVEWAKRELNWVGAFLKDAEAKQNKDDRVKQWVKEVREAAYVIEDALEKFLVDVEGASNNSKNVVLERASKGYDKMMGKVKKWMSKIRENCESLKIMSIEGSRPGDGRQPIRQFVMPEIDVADIVGLKDVDNICNLLLYQRDLRRAVISILGAGGRGKTTLATKVYNRDKVQRHFQSRIWLTVSCSKYRLIGVLKKMLQELGQQHASKDQEYLIRELHKSLKDKRYLIVLDDVWSTDLWNQLEVALPEDNNGSRVLITTRDFKVAESMGSINDTYQLQSLDEDESTKLLLKKAFPNRSVDEIPNNLFPLVNQFLEKCGGSPLALVVLGGILSNKHPNYSTWGEIMSKMNCSTEGNWCMNIISTSYDDLPVHLKPCFMYFAAFPEDAEIRVSRLIRMWIAEGFIQQEPTKAMEDTAMNYLEELVQRCMVQVTRQSRLEKMRSCRIHYILHELAINKARENDFLTIYSKSIADSISTLGRRVACREFGIEPKGAIGPNLRSLFFDGSSLLDCNELRMARVLDISIHDRGVLDLKWLQHVGTTLRYLRFGCYLQITNLSWLAHLKHLQMLEIYGVIHEHNFEVDKNTIYKFPCCNFSTPKIEVSELPWSFWDNKMLRSAIFENYAHHGPPSSANLENLLKLKGVVARGEWATQLPHFPRIRKLVMYLTKVDHSWEAMSNLMSELENLASLSIEFPTNPTVAYPVITPAFTNYKRMRSLTLHGKWPRNVAFDGSLFPPNLVKLILGSFNLKKDPMPELEKLPHLRLLVLTSDAYWGEKLSCSRGGFRCLQLLQILSLHLLKEVNIEEGAMPMLNVLCISNCGNMRIVPDLQYLKNLHELRVLGLPSTFISRLNREDHHKASHIASIITDKFSSLDLE